jgi:hypothetical protein
LASRFAVSLEKPEVKDRRDTAKMKNRKINTSPATPLGRPSSPPVGLIPEVANVDIAWINAVSGISPDTNNPIQSAMVKDR